MQAKFIYSLLRIFILLCIVGVGLSAVYVARGLYADGSFFLFSLLNSNKYAPFDKTRIFVQLILETPVLWMLKLGIKDLNFLIRFHSFCLIGIPLGFWIAALLLQIRKNLFWLFVLAFAVSYFSSGFFAIGEYNLTYGVTALCASILFRRKIGSIAVTFLIFSAIALTLSYESMVFLGPLLFSLSIYRVIDEKHDGFFVKSSLVTVAVLFAAASAISAWSIIYPRDPAELATACKFGLIIKSKYFIYLIFMTVLIFALNLNISPIIRKSIVFAALVTAIVFLANRSWWNTPYMNFEFRSVSGLMLFGVLLASIFYYYQQRNGKELSSCTTAGAVFIIVILFVSLCIPFSINTIRYRDWVIKFQSETRRHSGLTPVERTGIYDQGGLYDRFSWDWTNTIFSVLLRGNVDCVILNPKAGGYDLIDPKAFDKNTLNGFKKSSALF